MNKIAKYRSMTLDYVAVVHGVLYEMKKKRLVWRSRPSAGGLLSAIELLVGV
jgi:hypothetical protein